MTLPASLIPPIADLEAAMQWVRDLCAARLDFHFDDDPAHIVNTATNEPAFDPADADIIRARVLELYDFDWGPTLECPVGFMRYVIDAREHVADVERRVREVMA